VGAPTGMALPHPVLLVLALLWVLGSLLLAVRFWRRSREIHRCVRLSEPAGAALRRRVAAAARRLGVRAPRVRRLEGIASPFLWGTRRPVLLWPATHWTEAEVDSVLLHELAHLRRGDPWTSWAELLVRVLCVRMLLMVRHVTVARRVVARIPGFAVVVTCHAL